LYGYKPTHGAFKTTAVLVAIADQDTPGFLTRSSSIFAKLGKWWAKDTTLETEASTPIPLNLLYFAHEPALVQPVAEGMKFDFFAKVAAALNMSTSSTNVTERWNSIGPSNGEPISSYMEYIYSD
jgi:Asp-tRNA(Asn)/Glu-tRNA(Gln) amidotransferase A subunit family amidase